MSTVGECELLASWAQRCFVSRGPQRIQAMYEVRNVETIMMDDRCFCFLPREGKREASGTLI